jgi:hypothetical protein
MIHQMKNMTRVKHRDAHDLRQEQVLTGRGFLRGFFVERLRSKAFLLPTWASSVL